MLFSSLPKKNKLITPHSPTAYLDIFKSKPHFLEKVDYIFWFGRLKWIASKPINHVVTYTTYLFRETSGLLKPAPASARPQGTEHVL